MILNERHELFEVNRSWSGTWALDLKLKRKTHQYIFSTGLQNIIIKTNMPDYFILEHDQFINFVNSYSQNELKERLGIKKINLSYYGVLLSFNYVYEYNKFNIGLGSGVIFYTSFDNIKEFNMVSSPHISDKNVGLILKRNWARSYTEFKIQIPISKKICIETGLEMNLLSFVFPLNKEDVINEQFVPPSLPGKGPNPGQYVSSYKVYTYNVEVPLDRIKFFSVYLKIIII
ncbi:MAG: hypothetical protein QXE07_03195 [Thermoplasmata archaeon]